MRVHALWVLLATAAPGMLFTPVFGAGALVPPIVAVLVACYLAVEVCERVAALRPWRPVLALAAGLLALAEVSLHGTTLAGLPTGETLHALAAGVTDSWQLTLQSTWPVRPEPELLLFVPMLVLLTAMVGVELLRWPAAAVLPSLASLLLSQAFVAVSGVLAALVALAYAAVVAGLFSSRTRTAVVLTVVSTVVAGVAATAVPVGQAYSVRDDQDTQVPLPRTVSPLSEVAGRLSEPDTPVFSYTSDAPVDRWRIVVLDEFNGVAWSPSDRYRLLGSEIGPPSGVRVPTASRSAHISVPGDGPWLPSQPMPAALTGAAPLVDQDTGTLRLAQSPGPVEYELRWWEPRGELDALAGAAVSTAVVPGDVGVVPADIVDIARKAAAGGRPTFQTALMLEKYLSRNYRVATGAPLPTGSGWPQLRQFLLTGKRGTSEQFAAAYVILARVIGIPARLAVGYRAPESRAGGTTVVRNRDAAVWPEVAVDGFGWVPLDPTVEATDAGPGESPLAKVTERARGELPPLDTRLPDPPVPDEGGPPAGGFALAIGTLVLWGGGGLVALVALVLLATPVARLARTVRRRRLSGVPGVVGAWSEARDLLRAHGTRVTPGMTARDLAAVADASVGDSLRRLAAHLDTALWSGEGADTGTVAGAWSAVREIRVVLAGRPLVARLKAVFAIR